MRRSLALIGAVSAILGTAATAEPAGEPFRWGAASAAYQVEGAINADGKGRSVWDHYLDDLSLAGPGMSGAVAINFYDRSQYLKDIALMKEMGLTSYRFSISWPRIIPDGVGPANPAAIAHYRQFIADLKAAGIKPMLTLYHWDMPLSLARAGGWDNRQSIEWFRHYADVVFANFHDQVDLYVLVNEPLVERAMKRLAERRIAGGEPTFAIVPSASDLPGALRTFNHLLLASAAAKKSFDSRGYQGRLGLAVPLFPTLTAEGANADDRDAAVLADGVMNRWFLDAMYKGHYPADVLAAAAGLGGDLDVQPGDAEAIAAARFDYLGINFYSPLFIRRPADATTRYAAEMFLPEGTYAAFNGAVRPDQFKVLLDRIRTEYGNPPVFITENGAGFPGEDKLVDGKVNDRGRCRYLVDHIAAMKAAMKDGADVRGYHVWSSHDNLEWLFGYGSRFGMIYVDFDTQARTPKLSARVYSDIIKGKHVTDASCGG
ncbi:family 1 glycosylhydrolase [Sphingomonas sp. BK235]|uniref:glycoside hydrolase family 1 protein n=1 Tax=Sphingomonas sp. BK235 TaxID=2512131 RepID=UPI00104E483D|nr:family 1 glycosylhydrolase [Sphingomonas sp. BK235]TCP32436.1 beta-glucosidase [Sphingomonas sp. BK235]